MITPEFTNYIRRKLMIGVSKEEIAKVVLKNGWTTQDLNEAFNVISKNLPNVKTSSINQEVNIVPNRNRKKLAVSLGLILASIAYAFYQNTSVTSSGISSKELAVSTAPKIVSLKTPTTSTNQFTPPQDTLPVTVSVQDSPSTPPKKIIPVIKAPTPKPIPPPTPKPIGQYADGVYTGDPADAYYGTIQVEAVIKNGALADVQFLQYPSDRNTSVRINNRAMPILRQEAISAQSANVNIVSGATDSSQAFRQSIASALTQARN